VIFPQSRGNQGALCAERFLREWNTDKSKAIAMLNFTSVFKSGVAKMEHPLSQRSSLTEIARQNNDNPTTTTTPAAVFRMNSV
jgi:hypothetical protein